MANEFETIVMRFRDLVTENDETIKKHQEVIKCEGFVWWGWWKKGNEVTPYDEFASLAQKAKETSIKCILLDSGQEKVYYAICEGIEFKKDAKQPSPDSKKTPEYYNEQEYYAWFKLIDIYAFDDVNDIKKYTYIEVDSLFADKQSDYSKFNCKRIFGTKELIQQNRTIWFVRKFKEQDRDGEIVLLNSNYVEPSNFSTRYYECDCNTLVWLSDLHLPDKVFKVKKDVTTTTLSEHIVRNLDDSEKNPHMGGLIITGDITSRGEEEGFRDTYELITDLNRKIGSPVKSENIIFCPGNHDFKRKEGRLGDSLPEKVSLNKQNISAYRKFYHAIHNLYPNEFFSCGKKLLLPSGRTIEIVALNSLLLQQYEDFEGHGYISQEQLDCVDEHMIWSNDQENSSVRIVIMHHHYLPTCFKENIDVIRPSSVVYDADRLMKWLIKKNVKLLLHGHKHQTFISQVSYPSDTTKGDININDLKKINIIGMGGTGAKDVDNKFATITFEKEKILLKFYRIYGDDSIKDSCMQTLTIPL